VLHLLCLAVSLIFLKGNCCNRFAGKNISFHSRELLEHYYSLSETYVRLLMLPPKERHDMLLQTYPWMFGSNRIKEKMLAAYIGVTPETFRNYRNGK
jgi:hypothetical protein